MDTLDIVLITSISNLILQPILQYMLNSRCTHIQMGMGCIQCDRELKQDKKEEDIENQL
jgi:hypothetical protein